MGTFPSYGEALEKGYATSDTDVFFVKQIESPSEGIHGISTPFQSEA
jgi:hypothetical protein